MALTDLQIKSAKPKAEKYTLSAGRGLTLIVMPDGAKYWRLRYRHGGKRRMIAVGSPYPQTGLKEAQGQADRYRALVVQGLDPANQRRTEKLAAKNAIAHTFGEAAESWHAFRSTAWKAKTATQAREYLDKDILPKLRHRPLDEVTPPELAALIASIEKRKAFDVAKKARQWLKAIYSYSRAYGWTTNDPARDLAALAMPAPPSKNYAHLPIDELPGFVKALDSYTGSFLVKVCAWLSLYTANRPGVTRTLRWKELDLDAGLWTIEKGRDLMKKGYYHITPLPKQAVSMLRELQLIAGKHEHVFIGRNDPSKPLSDNTVTGMFKRIGYKGRQTHHGLRHLISTALNDQGFEKDWVERQLAHGDPDKIRGTYNKAAYVEPRREMMQRWADYLDRLKGESHVVQLRATA